MKRSLVGLERIDRGVPRQRKGEGAKAGKEIGDALGAAYPLEHQLHQNGFGLLKEGARREPHAHTREIDLRRSNRADALAIGREPRHAERNGLAGKGAQGR